MIVDLVLKQYVEEGRLVHRLDKKTSGLMALAKSKEMSTYLGNMLK